MNYDKLRELAHNATPGPWITAPALSQHGGMFFGTPDTEDPSKTDLLLGDASVQDAEFIAAWNPATALALLDELRDAKAQALRDAARTAACMEDGGVIDTYRSEIAEWLEARAHEVG